MPLLLLRSLLISLLLCGSFTLAGDALCTRSPYEWQQLCNGTALAAGLELCRSPWCTLLLVEPDGMLMPEQRPWLLAARQYVCASLNQQRQQWKTPDAVNASVRFMGDSLEQSCGNMSQWRLSRELSDAFLTLYQFNHHTELLCSTPTQGQGQAPMDSFYYTRAPDILVLRQQYQRDVNASTARITSALNSAYSVNLTLLVLLILFVFASVIMALKMVAERSANRHWIWCVNQGAVNDDDDRISREMSYMTRVDDDLSSTDEEDVREGRAIGSTLDK